jgi:ferredoxin
MDSYAMPKVNVKIDATLCITAANCVGIAPDIFQIGDASAELINSSGVPQGPEYSFDAQDRELALLEEAVESCPTRAISFEKL